MQNVVIEENWHVKGLCGRYMSTTHLLAESLPPGFLLFVYFPCKKIRLIESNVKCRHLKKITCKGTLRQVLICVRFPPLLGYCLGWSSNCVSSESGQIQRIKLLQNMVSNRTQQSTFPTPSQPLTVCVYYTLGGKWLGEGGRKWTREK